MQVLNIRSSHKNSNSKKKQRKFSIIFILGSQYRSHSVLLSSAVHCPRWFLSMGSRRLHSMQQGSGRIPMRWRCVPKQSCQTHSRNSATGLEERQFLCVVLRGFLFLRVLSAISDFLTKEQIFYITICFCLEKRCIRNARNIHNSFRWQYHGENTEFWVVFFCWRLQAFRPPLHRRHRRKPGQSLRNHQPKPTKYHLDRCTSY